MKNLFVSCSCTLTVDNELSEESDQFRFLRSSCLGVVDFIVTKTSVIRTSRSSTSPFFILMKISYNFCSNKGRIPLEEYVDWCVFYSYTGSSGNHDVFFVVSEVQESDRDQFHFNSNIRSTTKSYTHPSHS